MHREFKFHSFFFAYFWALPWRLHRSLNFNPELINHTLYGFTDFDKKICFDFHCSFLEIFWDLGQILPNFCLKYVMDKISVGKRCITKNLQEFKIKIHTNLFTKSIKGTLYTTFLTLAFGQSSKCLEKLKNAHLLILIRVNHFAIF